MFRNVLITNQNGTFYYHRDHQGSIVALTDSAGAVVESFTYDKHYGTIINHTKTIETNNLYAYTGREFDTDELYYYRARYYDPQIQRFISEDPIGFASSDFNFYRYVENSPVNFVDPTGLCSVWEWIVSPRDCLKDAMDDAANPNFEEKFKKGLCKKATETCQDYAKKAFDRCNLSYMSVTKSGPCASIYQQAYNYCSANVNKIPICKEEEDCNESK